MKLSVYAQKLGITYRTAWNYYQRGMIPGAYQMPTGTIIVPLENHQQHEIVDIMKFCYDPDFLGLAEAGIHLHRPQEIVLKSLYMGTVGNRKLTLSPDDWMWLKHNEEHGDNHVTLEKLRYREAQREIDPTFRFDKLVLVTGRRCGKTLISSIISAYETYKLLAINNGDPQGYYNIPEGKTINVINITPDSGQAKHTLNELRIRLRSPFFANRIDRSTENSLRLLTDWELHLRLEKTATEGSIEIVHAHGNPSALRGRTAICLIFDEFGYWGGCRVGDREVYEAVCPSVAQFARKNDGLIVAASSAGPGRMFKKLADEGLRIDSRTLLFRMPTWVFNTDLTETNPVLQEAKRTNPEMYDVEFGAEWPKEKRDERS